jgi:5-methylcytosine-specific restriction endonuclease McrA
MNDRKNCKGCHRPIPVEGASRCTPCAEKHKASERARSVARRPRREWNGAQAKQRAKKRGASGAWTDEEMSKRAAALGNVCLYCGGPAGEADHFKPLSKGGTNNLENIVPSCGPCNRDKGGKDPVEWLIETKKVNGVIQRLLEVHFKSPQVGDLSPQGLPNSLPGAANLRLLPGNESPQSLPKGFTESTSREIYTPSSLEDRDRAAAQEWVGRFSDYRDAKRGLVITGPRDPFERTNRIVSVLGKNGVSAAVAFLTNIVGDEGIEAVEGVLLFPNLLDNAKFATRVEEVIEYRLARGLPTVVYIPHEPYKKKPRFQRLISRLMATCHHYGRAPLPRRFTEAEKEAALEAAHEANAWPTDECNWIAEQSEGDSVENLHRLAG